MADSILEEAQALVREGQRREDYDHPKRNFGRIAKVWSQLLDQKLTEDISAREVGLLMIALKLVRESSQEKRDNLVDIAGYVDCIELVEEADEEGGLGAVEYQGQCIESGCFAPSQYFGQRCGPCNQSAIASAIGQAVP